MSSLTDSQWQTAHNIARQIVLNGANAGELKKAMAYLRTCPKTSVGGAQFFKYLASLVASGDRIGHSERTADYYKGLNDTCIKYLKPLQDSPETILEILGWAGRLVYYYQASPIAELTNAPMEIVVESPRQAAIKAAAETANFSVGDVIEVTVEKIKGIKVTFLLPNEIRLTQKEPRKAASLTIGQKIKAVITEIGDSGVPRKIKLL
jgi:hypothetical protein